MSVQGDVTRDILEDYTLHSQVGSGSFAVVWKATRKSDGATVAVKDIATSKLNTKLRESLESEISILQRTHHPNIIRLYEIRRVRRMLRPQPRFEMVDEYLIDHVTSTALIDSKMIWHHSLIFS